MLSLSSSIIESQNQKAVSCASLLTHPNKLEIPNLSINQSDAMDKLKKKILEQKATDVKPFSIKEENDPNTAQNPDLSTTRGTGEDLVNAFQRGLTNPSN